MSSKAAGAFIRRFERLRRKAPAIVVGTLAGGDAHIEVLGDAREDSVFEIGSITKTFTALLLAEMCETGEVGLSDPLGRFFPNAREHAAGDITLLDLATHTARLRSAPWDLLLHAIRSRSDPYAGYGHKRLEDALGRVRKRRGIGRRFRYSNFGFAVLGHALAKAAGVRYDELLVHRICSPLRLTSTTIERPGRRTAGTLTGHKKRGKPVTPWDLAAFAPAGALRSSARDILTYLGAHLDPGATPLSRALRQVQTPKVVINRRLSVALGWMIATRKGRNLVWHNGGTGGFSSFAGFEPETGIGLVVLANARVAGPITRIGLQALETLSGGLRER